MTSPYPQNCVFVRVMSWWKTGNSTRILPIIKRQQKKKGKTNDITDTNDEEHERQRRGKKNDIKKDGITDTSDEE